MTELLLIAFLFLKTGEKFATQEIAGPTVAGFTDHLGAQLGVRMEPAVMNQPADAVRYVERQKPALGIVTPGFFLTYEKALGIKPLREIHRLGGQSNRWVLIARQEVSDDLKDWEGKAVASPLAPEERYLKAVVLQGKLGNEVRFASIGDVEGALFDLAEKTDTAFAAVLIDAAQWELYREDPDLGAALKALYTSPELPEDLLVVFTVHAQQLDVDQLLTVLGQMTEDEEGKTVLRSIQVGAVRPIDQPRLDQTRRMFHAE